MPTIPALLLGLVALTDLPTSCVVDGMAFEAVAEHAEPGVARYRWAKHAERSITLTLIERDGLIAGAALLAESLTALLDGGLKLPKSLAWDVDVIVRRWSPPKQAPELAAARTAAGVRLGANGVAFVLAVMSPTVARDADHLPKGELVDDGGATIEVLEQLADERDAVGATPFVSGTEAATVETMPPLGSITPKVPIDLEAMAASWTNRVQALIKSVRGE